MNGGPTYAIGTAGLAAGTHMVTARAYDNAGMDLVRYRTGGNNFNRQYWGAPTQANGMRGSGKGRDLDRHDPVNAEPSDSVENVREQERLHAPSPERRPRARARAPRS